MFLEIVTPDKNLFKGEVISVKFPGTSGKFEILNNHAPLISRLEKGTITVKTETGNETFEIESGMVEVFQNNIVVLA
jgi:F-type H+-transporting ATPase subunit epsilon